MATTGRDTVGTVDDLHESATRATGLDDFGPDDYSDGLETLLASYAVEARLTPLGSKITRSFLRGALVARLLSEAAWRQHPGHADVVIRRPIFVTGLPRTGTTALHRLLTADPAHQGPEAWLTEVPQPRPPRETWPQNPVFQRIQAGYEQHHIDNPEFMGVHYTSADMVEECWQLLRQSMRSVSYECLAHLPTYSEWLSTTDWTPAYRRHRRNLQLIGMPDSQRGWVLKNPSHLFTLDALMAAYPDALVIQTHRAPRTVLASVCSLAQQATEGWSHAWTGSQIGRDQLALWSRGLRRFTAARARYDPAQFHDVDYEDFVADPLGTVERIYEHFGLHLGDDAQRNMRDLHARTTSGRSAPAHHYRLGDFGLSPDEVDDHFERGE